MNRIDFANSIPIAEVYQDFSGFTIKDLTSTTVLCPFHEDSNPSMKLYTDKNKFKCYGCGFYGGPIDFVLMKLFNGEQNDFVKAVNILCDKYHYEGEDKRGEFASKTANDKTEYSKILTGISSLMNSALPTEDNYFTSRGISKEVQDEYLLGYCNNDFGFISTEDISVPIKAGLCNTLGESSYKNRWIIPIKDKNGLIIAWAGRTINLDQPRYINSCNSDYFVKSNILFNLDVAIGYDIIYVVEGFIDALSLITLGVKNVVALMGCSISEEQLNLLQGKKICLALDSDTAGDRATYKTIMDHKNIRFSVLKTLPYKDLNECLQKMKPEEVKLLITKENMETGAEFILDSLQRYTNLKDEESQEKAWRILSSLLGSREEEYRTIFPINLVYTPISFDRIWKIFDDIIKKEA